MGCWCRCWCWCRWSCDLFFQGPHLSRWVLDSWYFWRRFIGATRTALAGSIRGWSRADLRCHDLALECHSTPWCWWLWLIKVGSWSEIGPHFGFLTLFFCSSDDGSIEGPHTVAVAPKSGANLLPPWTQGLLLLFTLGDDLICRWQITQDHREILIHLAWSTAHVWDWCDKKRTFSRWVIFESGLKGIEEWSLILSAHFACLNEEFLVYFLLIMKLMVEYVGLR